MYQLPHLLNRDNDNNTPCMGLLQVCKVTCVLDASKYPIINNNNYFFHKTYQAQKV